jgi:hypothetical protein
MLMQKHIKVELATWKYSEVERLIALLEVLKEECKAEVAVNPGEVEDKVRHLRAIERAVMALREQSGPLLGQDGRGGRRWPAAPLGMGVGEDGVLVQLDPKRWKTR